MAGSTGWLRGVVKEVPSGDTLVIVGTAKQGPPPEKRITLSSLIAPKLVRALSVLLLAAAGQARSSRGPADRERWMQIILLLQPLLLDNNPLVTIPHVQGKRDGSSKDEPFAWESREFLRKRCIGQVRGTHRLGVVAATGTCSSSSGSIDTCRSAANDNKHPGASGGRQPGTPRWCVRSWLWSAWGNLRDLSQPHGMPGQRARRSVLVQLCVAVAHGA